MKLIDHRLTKKEIQSLKKKYGHYIKLTVDLKKQILMAGCSLHADGEKVLLKTGSLSENIWGGGINLKNNTTDTTAILNIRPNLANPSMEILDPQRRKKFFQIVKSLFPKL